jgi:outer membrane protein TolC
VVITLVFCVGPLLGCVHIVDATQPAVSPQVVARASQEPSVAGKEYDLAECLALGIETHPRIAAQRASLAAAEDSLRALNNLHVPGLLVPDLPQRQRQASLGVTAAAAALDQAQRETAYAVTRTYLSVLYARDQERVSRAVMDRLGATRDAAQKALDAGVRDATASDVKRATVYLRLAETRHVQASHGVKRALAGLKEAIGLGTEAPLTVPAGGLPGVDVQPSHDEILAGALSRRPEIIRANVFAEVTCLEVEAQATSHHTRKDTFANGSDIHSNQVPQTERNSQYRPGGVPPEMPAQLAGSRPERVKRAQSYHERALAMVTATRNLISLEAEDAFLRWEEAASQAKAAREAADTGDGLAQDLNKDYTAGLKVKVEDVINAWVLASQARAQYNEALYKQILGLAELERVGAGSFNARLPDLVAARPAPKQTTEKKDADANLR